MTRCEARNTELRLMSVIEGQSWICCSVFFAIALAWAVPEARGASEQNGPDDVLLRSCRLIQDQLHFNIVALAPVGFSRSTYRYHLDSFDWIEKVSVWRIHTTWAHSE